MRVVKERIRTFFLGQAVSLDLTHPCPPTHRYHLAYIFGGGEFFIELVETITEVPAFDSAWIDFCKYYNAADDE